jgi:hypothetical protein
MRYIFVLLFSAILIQPATALTIEVGSVSADSGKTVTVPITVSKAVQDWRQNDYKRSSFRQD